MTLLAYSGTILMARHMPRSTAVIHDFYTGLYVPPNSRSREHVIPVSVLRAHRFRKSAFAEENIRMVDISVNWFRSNHRFARLPFDHDKYMTLEPRETNVVSDISTAIPTDAAPAMDTPRGCYRLSPVDLRWLRENTGLDAFIVRAKEEDEHNECENGVRVAAFRNTRTGLFFPLCDTEPILDMVTQLSRKMYPANEGMRRRLLLDVLHPSFWVHTVPPYE